MDHTRDLMACNCHLCHISLSCVQCGGWSHILKGGWDLCCGFPPRICVFLSRVPLSTPCSQGIQFPCVFFLFTQHPHCVVREEQKVLCFILFFFFKTQLHYASFLYTSSGNPMAYGGGIHHVIRRGTISEDFYSQSEAWSFLVPQHGTPLP